MAEELQNVIELIDDLKATNLVNVQLLKIGEKVNHLGEKLVEFNDPNHECLGCAMCATRCPDFAITGVFKE